VTAPAILRNTVIDWDNMRDTYSWDGEANANAQDTAVARLMLMCGQSVKMGWGPSSGANFSAEAYIKYFGYDNSCYVGERRDYCIDDWFDMLYNEIEQGYPVLFSGFSSGGGHAFVLDGFDGENLFHLNWGWGGGSNGWFLVGILNPGDNSGIGASSSSDGYSMSQRALFNLRLPDTNNADTYLFIKDVSVVGNTTDNASIRAGFENRTGATGTFNTAIVKLDEDGGLSVVGSQKTISGMTNNTTQSKTFLIAGELTEGTYKLSPASKPSKGTEWRPKYNLRNHYIEAVVDANGVVTLNPIDINNGDEIAIDTIVFPGTRIAGKEQEVKVTYRNYGNEYFKEVRMFASLTQDKIYTESRSIVAVRKGETVEVSYFFTPAETGTYNLWFCTGSDGSGQVGTGTMEVIAESQAVKANLTVSSYTISNGGYCRRLVGKASIKNNARTAFDGDIVLQIWRQPGGSGAAWSGSSKRYHLSMGATKVASIDFDFEDLNVGDKYYLAASYVNQDGSLGNGGVWDLGGWMIQDGILTWKNDGTVSGQARRVTLMAGTTICGLYAECSNMTRVTPNKNPNTIYAFAASMDVPSSLDTCNAVSGSHASHINMVNDMPYYLPVSFEADSASFTYTFPEEEAGLGWHAFTMPFEADSAFVDDSYVSLDDTLKHFWIYEFAAQGDDGKVIFKPATVLRGATPYIIAADATMAGRSVVFRSLGVPFSKTGSDKMVVSSTDFLFHGNTLAPKMK
ncbi:MAG: C10 family peptidase, partial [Bacteroidaceae bacterium]|nr:C10 family peptidase [Bacteroidaceae bacterium]